MTGYRSKFLRHQCESNGCFITGLPCWDELITMFPRNIRPMDVDGFVEINGHFLFLEQKGEGVRLVQDGQGDALRMLSRLPQVTVLLFRPNGSGWDVLVWDDGTKKPFVTVTNDQLLSWMRWWVMNADKAAA